MMRNSMKQKVLALAVTAVLVLSGCCTVWSNLNTHSGLTWAGFIGQSGIGTVKL